jgi:hypothetical protein
MRNEARYCEMMRRILSKKTARAAGGEGKTPMGKCLAGK